jgi:hypothetical protein
MKKDPDHNSTDSAEIEALITRLERGQLRDEDAQLLARLLRLLLRLITLLQQKNASLPSQAAAVRPQVRHAHEDESIIFLRSRRRVRLCIFNVD